MCVILEIDCPGNKASIRERISFFVSESKMKSSPSSVPTHIVSTTQHILVILPLETGNDCVCEGGREREGKVGIIMIKYIAWGVYFSRYFVTELLDLVCLH